MITRSTWVVGLSTLGTSEGGTIQIGLMILASG